MQIKVDKEARKLLTECCDKLLKAFGVGALGAINTIQNATDKKDLEPKKKKVKKNGK